MNGGNEQWIEKGIRAVDPKLALIAPLNEVLANKPWIIDASYLEVSFKLLTCESLCCILLSYLGDGV